MTPVVSVVVPVYNVAPYLPDCLDSIAGQTYRTLQVVVVDDGSTDESADIARAFCARDERFRLVRQPNGGLGHARNTGIAHATGDLLAFVDSDDLLAPRAYETLVRALEGSDSDLATGAFRRLDETGSRPAYYAAAAFAAARSGEHITRFHALAVDRTAWNKVFRRRFWDAHGLRFGEGVQYEDQYATLPAYFLARSVEVLPGTVYYWRLRGESITQGREQPQAICDRLAAIGWTRQWLVEHGFAEQTGWYDESVLAQDLSYVPAAVAGMDDVSREPVLARLDDYLRHLDPSAFDRLPALERVAWELLRRHDLGRLQEVVGGGAQPALGVPCRRWRHWYLDHPLRRDRSAGLPARLFRVDDELAATSEICAVDVAAGRVQVRGRAGIGGLGAGRLRAWLEREGRRVPLVVARRASPELAVVAADDAAVGFDAGVDVDALLAAVDDAAATPGPSGGGGADADTPDPWRLVVEVRARGLTRDTDRHAAARLCAVRGAVAPVRGGRQVRAELTPAGELVVHVEPRRAVVTAADTEAGVLRLRGEVRGPAAAPATLRLTGAAGKRHDVPVELDGDGRRRTFLAAVPLAELTSDLQAPTAPQTLRRQHLDQWDLTLRVGKTSTRLVLASPLTGRGSGRGDGRGPEPDRMSVVSATTVATTGAAGSREWAVGLNRAGHVVLVERVPRPVVTDLVVDDGAATLTVRWPADPPGDELVLLGSTGETVALAAAGHGPARLDVARLTAGGWDVVLRRRDDTGPTVPAAWSDHLLTSLPVLLASDGRRGALGVRGRDGLALVIP